MVNQAVPPTLISVGEGTASANGKLYFADTYADEVSVFNASALGLITTIAVGDSPVSVVSGFGYVFVVNQKSNNISVIDDTTDSVVNTINVGSIPVGITETDNTDQVFVANYGSDSITVINLSGGLQNPYIYSIPVDGSPTGIVVDIHSNVVSVSLFNKGMVEQVSIRAINTQNYSVIGETAVGLGPMGITEDLDGLYYVADYGSDNVSVIWPQNYTYGVQTIQVRGEPIGVTTSNADYLRGASIFVLLENSTEVAVISNAAWFNPGFSLTNVSYPYTPEAIASMEVNGVSAGLIFNQESNTVEELTTYPVAFTTEGGPGYFLINNMVLGAPDLDLPATLYMPAGIYAITANPYAGYTSGQTSTTGCVNISSQTLNVQGEGAVTLSVKQVANSWTQVSSFQITDFAINLDPLSILGSLGSDPAEVYFISIQPTATQDQFDSDLQNYLGMSAPTGYSPNEVVIINAPVGKWADDLFQTTQLMQQWEYTFNLAGIPFTFTSSPDGSLNLALMTSASNSTVTLANIVADLDEGLIAIAKNNSGTLQTLVSSLISTIQDTGDFSLWDVVSNIGDSALTSNSIFDLSQFLNAVQTVLQVDTVTQDVLNVLIHGGESATTAGTNAISDTQFCADMFGFLIDTLPQGFPSLSTNDLYQAIQHGVDITVTWVDPNGTQIIPSFYDENGTLVLGYDPTSSNIIYSSSEGVLIAGDDVYRAYLQESGSDTYNMVLNSVGGQGIVPYIISAGVGQGNTQTYTGQVPEGTQPSIALVPASSNTLVPQLQATASLSVTGTEGAYVLTVVPQLSNGSPTEATAAYALIDGTTYQMTEVNPDSFTLNLPASFTGGSISAYVIVLNVVGGYGSIFVNPTLPAPAPKSPNSVGNKVSGTMGMPSVTVTVPGDLNLGTLNTLGSNGPVESTGSVATVLATDWTVTATAAVPGTPPVGYVAGAMSDGGKYLTEPLSISKDGSFFVPATSTLEWNDVTSFNFYAEQTISQADVTLGQAGQSFSIEIIFTGNFVD
jgi:YVTN family beta-propeller protein